jgi:hypothetical protein
MTSGSSKFSKTPKTQAFFPQPPWNPSKGHPSMRGCTMSFHMPSNNYDSNLKNFMNSKMNAKT